jgi:hypothetical protein
MASKQRIARKLGCLLACLWFAGAGCDDDSAADKGHSHAHGEGHSHAHGEGHSHAEAGSGGHEHQGDEAHAHDRVIGPLTGTTCPDDGSTLTYENFGKKFMQDYCLRCHSVDSKDRQGAPDDHNFDTLADVDFMKAHIDQYAGSGPKATNTKMPMGDPKPTVEERQKLSEWLACGPD